MKSLRTSIGTAGWSIPWHSTEFFPEQGSQLDRYSSVFSAVEINSTFYNYHRPQTFEKWSLMTPDSFQFCLKLHRQFTHDSHLTPDKKDLRRFLKDASELGDKWKVLLLQFPPKQIFEQDKMQIFFDLIRKNYQGDIVVEPRNVSWINSKARIWFENNKISKVVADPQLIHGTNKIETAGGLIYFRLHGSPEIYRSSYHDVFIKFLSGVLIRYENAWCIFDNTTLGFGTINALDLIKATSLHLLNE